jgi:hypothetical protein
MMISKNFPLFSVDLLIWVLVIGDCNLVRSAQDKKTYNNNYNASLAAAFNDTIQERVYLKFTFLIGSLLVESVDRSRPCSP